MSAALLPICDAERARDALWAMDSGCDGNRWVRIGMAAKAAGLEFEDFDAWSATAGNYGGQSATRSRWRSFRDGKGITAGTLFYLAHEEGWRDDAPRRVTPQPAPQRKPEPERAPRYKAAEVWARCVPATPDHRYIVRKGGRTDGLGIYPKSAKPVRVYKDDVWHDVRGWLTVPAFKPDGELATLQFISPVDGGPKLNLPGHRFDGGFFTVGELRPGVVAYIAEGIGAAWSAHAATGCPALVAFGSGNQTKVAAAAKAAGARPVIVADRGKESQCQSAAKELGCAWVAMPADMPGNGDINDIQQAEGLEAVAAILSSEQSFEQAAEPAKENTPHAFAFTRVGDMLHHLKPIDWLVKGYLEADSLALMFGDPACGKSFLAIDLACAVATGSEWHGMETKRGAVFYIAGEGHNGLAKRFKSWEVLNEQPLSDAPLFVSHRSASLYDAASAELVSQSVQALASGSGHSPRLIVIDTLARNFGGADENSTSDMNAFVTNLDAHLKGRFKACVLIVHHTGHADKTRARGAMALKGALDAEYQVERDEAGTIRINTTKMKDAEAPEPLSFRLDRVGLPFVDEDGQQIFGAALKSTDYVPPPKAGREGRGKNQTKALAALLELYNEHRDRLDSSGLDPEGARVKLDDWRERCNFESRNTFWKVKETLQAAGKIRVDALYVELIRE